MSSSPSITPRLAITLPVEEDATLIYGEGNSRELFLDSLDIVVALTGSGEPALAMTARGTRVVDGALLPDSRPFVQVDELPQGLREIVQEQVNRLTRLVSLLVREGLDMDVLGMPTL